MNEADTCRKFVVPKLQAAGWETEPHSIAEQRTITDGRIVPAGKGFIRRPPKRVDYLLRYRRDFPLAVIEAKAAYKLASDDLQQAKDYATMLGLKFAYATNGQEIVEFDFLTGIERTRVDYPTPSDLWRRYRAATHLSDPQVDQLLTPFNHAVGKGERYYQQIAVNRVVEAILTGRRRLLVTMATGTGKTAVAFQICWKLWTGPLESNGRTSPSPDPLPRGPQHPHRSAQGRDLRGIRRCAVQDRVGRGGQEPGDVLRHLPVARRGRAARGVVPVLPRRLLRPRHRGRVPPRERA
jgi:type I restriction enzyme R subunit